MDKEQALALFRQTQALLEGHFLLTSGLHSPQYFQCAKVLQYTDYTEKLCQPIAEFFARSSVDCVISPAIGGIVVGQEVARQLSCRSIFAERENNIMTLRRGFELKAGERVIAVEDVVTTGGSIKEVIQLAKKAGAEVLGAGFIVDRSAGKAGFDVPTYAVLEMEVVTYSPDQCPLCRQGLSLEKPGSRKMVQPI